MKTKDLYARQMINDLYANEQDEAHHEAFQMKMSTSVSVSDVTMIDAIASRFNSTRTAIVSDILHNSVLEMYFALTLNDKISLSEIADIDTTRILTKNGVTAENCGFGLPQGESSNEDQTWRCYAALYKQKEEKSLSNSDKEPE